MKRKYLVEFGMLFCLVLGMLTGCGQKEEEARVYYLTYKPEAADSWKEIAEAYEAETGIEVRILTSAVRNAPESVRRVSMSRRQ